MTREAFSPVRRVGRNVIQELPVGLMITLLGSRMVFAIDDRRRHLGSEVWDPRGSSMPRTLVVAVLAAGVARSE